MSFKNFKSISDVQSLYPVFYREKEFISNNPLPPSQPFLDDYAFNMEHLDVLNSESSRRENLIYPILKDVYKHYAEKLSLWNQKPLRYDKALSGVPNYMISVRSPLGKTFLEKPLLNFVEAKKNDFEQGWGQCLAELIASQKLNADYTHSNLEQLFGCLNGVLQDAVSNRNINMTPSISTL